jgi:phosphopantetheinyl transferase (holo-ACP synthase)
MILGIGIDIAEIGQFAEALKDPATHFLAAHFTPGELAYVGELLESAEPVEMHLEENDE